MGKKRKTWTSKKESLVSVLPTEMFLEIFSFLNVKTLLKVRLVNKELNEIFFKSSNALYCHTVISFERSLKRLDFDVLDEHSFGNGMEFFSSITKYFSRKKEKFENDKRNVDMNSRIDDFIESSDFKGNVEGKIKEIRRIQKESEIISSFYQRLDYRSTWECQFKFGGITFDYYMYDEQGCTDDDFCLSSNLGQLFDNACLIHEGLDKLKDKLKVEHLTDLEICYLILNVLPTDLPSEWDEINTM